MTEVHHIQDDDCIVVVNAQVMVKDENKGGWVPLGRGGLSRVGLLKTVCSRYSETRHEYRIRVLDRIEVLDCVLTKDVKYVIANPNFIHWHIEDKKFGLTFQSSHEAKAFEQGVQQVVDDLLQGHPDINANTCITNLQNVNNRNKRPCNSGEEDVFMSLDLPMSRKGSGSTVSTTTTTSSPQSPALHNVPDTSHDSPKHRSSLAQYPISAQPLDRAPGVDDPIMHKVVYMNPGGKSPTSSGKSHSSVLSSIDANTDAAFWQLRQRQNEANEQHQLLAALSFQGKPGAPGDEDFDSSSYVHFNHGGGGGRQGSPPNATNNQHHAPVLWASGRHPNVGGVGTADHIVPNHDYSYPMFDSTSQKDLSSPSSPAFRSGHFGRSFDSGSATSPRSSTHRNLTPQRPDSISGLRVHSNRPRFPSPLQQAHPPLPMKPKTKKLDKKKHASSGSESRPLRNQSGRRELCQYCDEAYLVDENRRGACKDAPDCTKQCIDRVSCLFCARGVLYHCVSKEEHYDDPYDCDRSGAGATDEDIQCKKCTVLTFLTLFVPCLWCYCLLRACHRCGSACGCCGGRHRAT